MIEDQLHSEDDKMWIEHTNLRAIKSDGRWEIYHGLRLIDYADNDAVAEAKLLDYAESQARQNSER